MSDARFIIGEVARLSVRITDAANTLIDPASLVLLVKNPAGVLVTYIGTSIVKDAVGRYHADITLTQAGLWKWRWQTGGVVSVSEGSLLVKASLVV